jgi:hypothetical protein
VANDRDHPGPDNFQPKIADPVDLRRFEQGLKDGVAHSRIGLFADQEPPVAVNQE